MPYDFSISLTSKSIYENCKEIKEYMKEELSSSFGQYGVKSTDYQFFTYYGDFIEYLLAGSAKLADLNDILFIYNENKDCLELVDKKKRSSDGEYFCLLFSLLKKDNSDSILYTLLNLSNIPSVTYNFNIMNLPISTKNKISDNDCPPLYYYLQKRNNGFESLPLNMIEYYLFSFLRYGGDNSIQRKNVRQKGSTFNSPVNVICNTIYPNLCFQYYKYFLSNKNPKIYNVNNSKNLDNNLKYSAEFFYGIQEFWLNNSDIRYNTDSLLYNSDYSIYVYLILYNRIIIIQILIY